MQSIINFGIKLKHAIALFIFAILLTGPVYSQCTSTITSFPYTENFDVSTGGWSSGGTLNDWAWGSPSKPVINRAGSGPNCWIIGGLTTSFYNYGERSYVLSPCFDFTSLQHPFIAFLIFWESEHTYDGMNLEYSLNGGSTWNNVGRNTDPVDCMNQNWYNTSSVTYLTGLANPKNGWTGNIQATSGGCQGGFGSSTWVQARHCMAALAGQSSVMFRFAFGAGTTCNSFDGIAFDSVSISEAPAISADFSYTCSGSNLFSFTATTSLCPDSFGWNFGDPGSGSSNTASTLNASHTFSSAGPFTVSFTAAGPCNSPVTVSKVITPLSIQDTIQEVACYGGNTGAITVRTSGGTSPYVYNWGGGITTQNRSGLDAGTYTLTVTDSNHCSKSISATITQPLTALSATSSASNASCSGGGTAHANASGGTGSYSYNWGGGDTSQTATGLGPGTYTVTVTDQNLCTATAAATVNSSSNIIANFSQTNVRCAGDTNGSIVLNVSGGIRPYHYLWAAGDTNSFKNNLAAGTYSVTVTDSSGCIAIKNITISQPLPLQIVDTISNIKCFGQSNGAVNLGVSGGTLPYLYNWGGGIFSENRNGLLQGSYTVTVTDSNNCMRSVTANILQPQPLSINATTVDPSCFNQNNGSIIIQINGGTTPYAYNWGAGLSSQNLSGLAAGIYNLTVSDSNLCTLFFSDTVTQPGAIKINGTTSAPVCPGQTNGSIEVSVSGGKLPYSYLWSPAVISGLSDTSLGSGSYILLVTDSAGCTAKDTFVVGSSQNSIAKPNLGMDTFLCPGKDSIELYAGNYDSYLWQNGSTASNLLATDTGIYWVLVSNSSGCTSSDSILISPRCEGKIVVPNAFTPNGDGNNDYFFAKSNVIPGYFSMHIYNSWGQLVFESDNIQNGWDGRYRSKFQPTGVYVYFIQYSFGSAAPTVVTGTLTLIY